MPRSFRSPLPQFYRLRQWFLLIKRARPLRDSDPPIKTNLLVAWKRGVIWLLALFAHLTQIVFYPRPALVERFIRIGERAFIWEKENQSAE